MNAIIPLVLMTIGNTWVACGWYLQKNIPMCIVFLCYAVSTAAFGFIAYKGLT